MTGAAEVACRSCGATALEPILSLGRVPLANSLLRPDELDRPEPLFPLDLVFCSACSLVQITETVPPEVLFREYVYLSSVSDTVLENAERLATRIVSERRLGEENLVVEAASNDGYLLQYYREQGVSVLGIEPARNIAEIAEQRGIPTISEFFDDDLARRLHAEGRTADVFHGHNVLAHVAKLNEFVRGIGELLERDGVAVIEVPYVRDMLDTGEFDQIYHEHLCYFSVTALTHLFERHGLRMVDVERIPVHGGSLRVFVAPTNGTAPSGSVTTLLAEEGALGVPRLDYYLGFAERVTELKSKLRSFLGDLKSGGATIAGYGAAGKATTLLNFFQIGRETLDFVVDRNPVKQGLYMPGVHLPIEPPEKLLEKMPSHVLLLTWNLADEILEQQSEYRRRGGTFVIPLPELSVV